MCPEGSALKASAIHRLTTYYSSGNVAPGVDLWTTNPSDALRTGYTDPSAPLGTDCTDPSARSGQVTPIPRLRSGQAARKEDSRQEDTIWALKDVSFEVERGEVVGSAHLITKVYFRRLIIPIWGVLSGLMDFAIAFLVLIGLMVGYGDVEGSRWAWLGRQLAEATPPGAMFAASLGVWMVVLLSGAIFFRRTERTLADVI